jgi:hypothetical protein
VKNAMDAHLAQGKREREREREESASWLESLYEMEH